jgi:hypothetical protein
MNELDILFSDNGCAVLQYLDKHSWPRKKAAAFFSRPTCLKEFKTSFSNSICSTPLKKRVTEAAKDAGYRVSWGDSMYYHTDPHPWWSFKGVRKI